MDDLAPVEYLYGIDSSVHDDHRFAESPRVVEFKIIRKTPHRVYYIRAQYGEVRPDGTYPKTFTGYVDRESLERDGFVRRKSAGWWERDATLYLNPPDLRREDDEVPDLAELKAQMAAAHPDRGGSDEDFIRARTRWEAAARKSSV